jgi:WD40 repeat protein
MDGTAKVFDAATGDELFTLSGHTDSIFGLAYSPDGTRLATASHDKTVKVWDAASGKLLMTLSKEGHGDGVYGGLFPGILDVAFSADSARIASAGADGTAVIWDVATGKELLMLPSNGNGIITLAFNPDGTHLATSSDGGFGFDPTVTMWNLTTHQAVFTTPNQPNFIFGLAFDNGGSRFATGAVDGVLRLWDSKTGKELLTLPGHTYTLVDIDFSVDGQYIATAGFEGTAKLWDAETGKELLTLIGHTGGISGVSFSPDGTRLATSSADGTVRVYLLNIEELIALAKSRVTRSLTTEECQKYLHVEACPGD